MTLTYDELSSKTVAELREIARDAVQGASQMNKEHLLPALCKALGVEMRAHHDGEGADTISVEGEPSAVRAERDRAIETHDHLRLKSIRRQIQDLNQQVREDMD